MERTGDRCRLQRIFSCFGVSEWVGLIDTKRTSQSRLNRKDSQEKKMKKSNRKKSLQAHWENLHNSNSYGRGFLFHALQEHRQRYQPCAQKIRRIDQKNRVLHLLMSKTNAQLQKDYRDRKRKAGLVEVRNVWARPEDHERIKQYAKRLNKK